MGQLTHVTDWVLFEENLSEYISIDETCLSQGELYTVVTNTLAKGKKGTLVAMIKGTDSEYVSSILNKITESKRNKVKEVTLDMAASMQKIVRSCLQKPNKSPIGSMYKN